MLDRSLCRLEFGVLWIWKCLILFAMNVWLILTVDFMMLCGIFFLNEGFEEGRFSGIYM